jgi:hypothetical protein
MSHGGAAVYDLQTSQGRQATRIADCHSQGIWIPIGIGAMRCGARNRKLVSEITDRAKRYRAHTPECRPDGPKRCFKCGSRRFVVPDHIDGDESNGRKSNLRWACKSHNTILGKRMAKAGKGKRTRQFNPSESIATIQHRIDTLVKHIDMERYLEAQARTRVAEYAQGDFRGASRGRRSAESQVKKHAKLLKLYEGELEQLRAKYAKGAVSKNPGAKSLGEYVSAAVSHTRGAHDEGGKVIHETPKSKRREFAREIWNRRGMRNPASPADRLYRKFHGRGPDAIQTMLVKQVDPYGGHPELTQLGPLIRFIVGEGVELGGEFGDVVKVAEWVNEICFVPSMRQYRSLTERLDPKDGQEIQKFKAWLRNSGTPDVAAVPNTRQLYVVGGNQNIDSKLKELGADPEKDLIDLGFCYLIEYFSQKKFDRYEPTTYFHHFGEKTGIQPRLIYDRVHHLLQLVGGEYVVKSVGIDN